MFVSIKIAVGFVPTMDWLAKVIPLVLQTAVEDKFGWLNETAKIMF